MDFLRLNLILLILASIINGKSINRNDSKVESTTHNCPFTKIIEDIFKMNNKTNISSLKDNDKANLFLNALDNLDAPYVNKTEEELINNIIASIKRIKDNLTSDSNDSKLNNAIILSVENSNKSKSTDIKINQIKSGIEDKLDIKHNKDKTDLKQSQINVTDKLFNTTKYIEIQTFEPNKTFEGNRTSYSIMDVLKQIMPILNTTTHKDLHSITIIERKQDQNHSFSETKNVSTILVTYCNKTNEAKKNDTSGEELKSNVSEFITNEDYYLDGDDDYKDLTSDLIPSSATNNTKEVLEAAEYGIQKMHELYGVLEPKLYSMGLMLNEKDPARYVAAFNAPSEDIIRYSRYGYASLQAASKLKELTRDGYDDKLESREGSVFFGPHALRQSPLLEECPLRGPPKCPPASKRYRTHDGTCNNLSRLRWGSTMTPVQRFLEPVYSDGIQAPRRSIFGSQLPSAREVSALVHEDKDDENVGITHLLMQWGQFLDHDITSSSQSRGFNGSVPRCCVDGGRDFVPKEFMHPECFPIPVPPSDPFYGPLGVRCLDFVRSSPAPHDDCALGWREQFNQVSAYIDGSPLYASSARQSDNLRLFRNGMLQYGRAQVRRPQSPAEREELCRGGAVSTDCFRSGDARVNEHPGLVAAHIVWLRHHNRMAQELTHLNPHWSDEKIYQETRKIVGAMIQHITYREFLPIVLGTEVMHLFELELQRKGYWRGYSPKINPSPASSFGSAAFRFGHSLVQRSMVRYNRLHRPIPNNVSLHDELTNPSNIWSMGAMDRLLFGMMNQPIQKRDEFITEELTNHLFQTPHFKFGMDLAAINIQRGRDHGVPPYTAWRDPCGLSTITEFDDLVRVMPARVVRKLKILYRHVDDIDLFTGGMAERPVVGGLVGPTFACIIAQQFSNLRKGDRFWYENGEFESSFTPAQLQQIRQISLAQVLCRTLDTIESIQPFVFLSPSHPDNQRISCFDSTLNDFDLSPWTEINTESNNVRKSDDEPVRPNRTKQSTMKPSSTTKKSIKGTTTSKPNRKQSLANKAEKLTDIKNENENNTKVNATIQRIDDKLDFKNKSLRFSDDFYDRNNPPRQYNDYDDDVHSVQSVVVNNSPHKRPYRPYLTVTENVDKYTYLINYVPRPTQSWRQTTKRNYDRDVVKVTYQNYDDTYRRPNRPYFNRQDMNDEFESRHNRPKTDNSESSARSNSAHLTLNPDQTERTTNDLRQTTPKLETVATTSENKYKLTTFSYVGTYRGDLTRFDNNDSKDSKSDNISKDFSIEDSAINDKLDIKQNERLSTFFTYDTVTKPYNLTRPIRKDDEEHTDMHSKYYYDHNVLHKYPDSKTESQTQYESLEQRSAETKLPINAERPRDSQIKAKKTSSSAKTPSVAFQIIPSENSPSLWAVYEEDDDIPERLPPLPQITSDPYALREVPKPILRPRRRPGF